MSIPLHMTSVNGKAVMSAQLLTNSADVGDGEWIDVVGLNIFSVQVTGISGDTVHVRGSNKNARPDNTAHEELIGAAITTDGIYSFNMPLRWLKARQTVNGAGTINVYLVAAS